MRTLRSKQEIFGWRVASVLACLDPRWCLSVCVGSGDTSPACRSRCAVQVVEPGFGEPLFVPLLRTGTEDIKWKLVGTGRQERKDQWKRERCAHQATVQRCPGCEQPRCLRQWREISEYETVACADCNSVQSTDRIGSFRRQRTDATSRIPLDRFESQTAWSKADWTTSRWAAWSHFEVPEANCRSADRQSGSRSYHHQRDRGHCELPNPTRRTRTTPHYIYGVSQSRRAEQRDA